MTLIALFSDAPGTKELKELSLAINTSEGMVLIVGCSHPGIEKIVEAGKVETVAPGHCAGEPMFTALKKAYGDRYLYAGLGHYPSARAQNGL